MGPFGVIPKPFRMVRYSEASPNGKAVPNGWLFGMESYSMCSLSRENAERNVCGFVWLDLDSVEWLWVDLSSFNEILNDFVDLGRWSWLDLSGPVWI